MPAPPSTDVAAGQASSFHWSLRVYWEDTDAGGVVFYANYLKFFERARTEWLRQLGVEQQALRDRTGALFVVTDTQLSYHAPARLDDLLRITVERRAQGTASMTLAQQAWRGDKLLAQGQIRVGCVDATTFKPRRLPADITRVLQPLPPGAPSLVTATMHTQTPSP
jgi:acyl-CoA thioester hydrolase